jgi:quercetin dioxygenase-like cupin family protein
MHFRMHIIEFGADRATAITEYASRDVSAQPLADGAGEAHVYVVHLASGGEIGVHRAGFGQLFLVIRGEGWVAGDEGVRRTVRTGQGAVIARGEVHAKGSDTGCTAIMIQLAELLVATT